MKVIVRCANNRVTKTEMEQIIESLFQENKDLRVQVGHLRDDLNLSQQQSEARRQVICERDKLIQELNEEVQASNDELENVQCDLVDHVKLQEEMCDTIDDLRIKVANACADRDNFEASYKQVLQWWEAAQSKVVKAEATADEYRIAAMESDCRVNECEKRMDWLSKEVMEWKATAEGYKNQYEELKAQKEADDKKSEEICTACNELQDKLEAEHNLRVETDKAYDKMASEAYDMHQQITNLTIDNTRLKNKVEELEAEVDTCHHNIDGYIEGNRRMRAEYEKKLEAEQNQMKHWRKKYEELMEEHNELEADYDALAQTKREYGEEIDRLRKVVIELQTNRFTVSEIQNMICKYLESHEPSSASFDF